jgi:hypothetical protein
MARGSVASSINPAIVFLAATIAVLLLGSEAWCWLTFYGLLDIRSNRFAKTSLSAWTAICQFPQVDGQITGNHEINKSIGLRDGLPTIHPERHNASLAIFHNLKV